MKAKYLIPAGLSSIPRQIAMFPEFRSAMLADIAGRSALSGWRARRHDDFGLMMLEMWAYSCDVLSFYDETIAHECYAGTARQRASLRRLVELLGYLPSPAVSAVVNLALLAEGYQPVTLPAGTAFRSSAFLTEAPQIFETEESATVYPQNNQWLLEKVKPAKFPGGSQLLLLKPGDANVSVGDCLMLQSGENPIHISRVKSVNRIQGEDGETYLQVELEDSLPAIGIELSQLKLTKTLRSATLWSLPQVTGDPSAVNNSYTGLILNTMYPDLLAGKHLLIECGGELRWFIANNVATQMMQPTALANTTVTQDDGTTYTFTPPPVKVPATRITLDVSLNTAGRGKISTTWSNSVARQMTVHYSFSHAGTLTLESKPKLESGDSLYLSGKPEVTVKPSRFLLEDAEQNGTELSGTLADGVLSPDPGTTWKELKMPVTLYSNVVKASRGESVKSEILGSGDASIPNQSFKLKKKPLTYLSEGGSNGDLRATSTLKLYVNDALWKEVPSFYSAGNQDNVYILRQNDDGETIITGGDGERGSRFPTGVNNIIAYYRFGAGADAPPAGSITQLARPVKGIRSIRNPVPATPGSDAQKEDSLRRNAPRSALLLGRAVSVQDFEAATANVPGVRAASAQWRWNEGRQQPVVQIWIIGPQTVRSKVMQTLRDLADPSIPLDVEVADGLARTLSINIDCDSNLEERITARVRNTLMDPVTGLLAPERVGIGKPLYRSRIFDAVLGIDGVKSVIKLLWEGKPFIDYYPEIPVPGYYYDFEKGALIINGKAGTSV